MFIVIYNLDLLHSMPMRMSREEERERERGSEVPKEQLIRNNAADRPNFQSTCTFAYQCGLIPACTSTSSPPNYISWLSSSHDAAAPLMSIPFNPANANAHLFRSPAGSLNRSRWMDGGDDSICWPVESIDRL